MTVEKMNSSYGLYKNVRNASWKFLIDFNICELPIDVFKICERLNIQIKSYEEFPEIFSIIGQQGRTVDEEGFCMLFDKNWFIFYKNDYRSYANINFVILHELAHILLGHKTRVESNNGKILYANKKNINSQLEKEADMFAIRIMSPACVLKELNLHTPEEIMEVCQLPYIYAEKRAQRIEELYKRNMFYKQPLEIKVREQFSPFVNRLKTNWQTESIQKFISPEKL